MHTRKLFSVVASCLLFCSLSSASMATSDERLKSSDHKSLAKSVSAYWQAKIDRKKISESFVKFSEGVEKTKKRLKGKHEILACMDDWKQVFWMATRTGLSNAKQVKKKISSWPKYGSSFPAFTYAAPKKHSAKGDPYPLILIVADEGEDPTAHLESKWADEALRAGHVLAVVEMKSVPPRSTDKKKDAPTGDPIPVEEWGNEAGAYAVMGTFANLTRADAFAIDFDRVFLAGSGKGFVAAATAARWFPQSFAGLIARGDVPEGQFSINLGNMATLVAGESAGGKDFAEGIKRIGQSESGQCADSDTEIAAWIKDQSRNAYPDKFAFQYPSNSTLRSYWIQASGIDVDAGSGSKLEASVDRDKNEITIQAIQVGTVILSLNDLIVDLSKPVRVTINGVTKEELLKRNQRLMVESVFRERDWGSLKTAEGTYPVPVISGD